MIEIGKLGFKMTWFRKETGKLGELEAAKMLKRKGFCIVCCNYRCRLGEIDIIAKHKGLLVFVEVRSCRWGSYCLPQETINFKKIERLRKVAQYYMMENNMKDLECRFDVIAVKLDESGKARNLEHIENAF